jgi:hypothetical protein
MNLEEFGIGDMVFCEHNSYGPFGYGLITGFSYSQTLQDNMYTVLLEKIPSGVYGKPGDVFVFCVNSLNLVCPKDTLDKIKDRIK